MKRPMADGQRPPATPIPVAIVDDHPPILASLAAAIESATDMVLVGTGRTLDDAMTLAASAQVLVCDVQLDGHAEGLEVLEAVHDPRVRSAFAPPAVILLSGFGYSSIIRTAIERGAAGYIDKTAGIPEILDAIRTVAAGGTVFTAEALRRSSRAPRRPSGRELEVIRLLVRGSSNAEIAAALGLSDKTVESHLRRLFDRYAVLSRTELAVLAIDEGWTAVRRDDR